MKKILVFVFPKKSWISTIKTRVWTRVFWHQGVQGKPYLRNHCLRILPKLCRWSLWISLIRLVSNINLHMAWGRALSPSIITSAQSQGDHLQIIKLSHPGCTFGSSMAETEPRQTDAYAQRKPPWQYHPSLNKTKLNLSPLFLLSVLQMKQFHPQHLYCCWILGFSAGYCILPLDHWWTLTCRDTWFDLFIIYKERVKFKAHTEHSH